MTRLLDADRCLLRDSALLSLASPDAAGLLYKRANISGWYRYWFSLSGSQLLYFERAQSARRGLLVGTISLFRHTLTVVNTLKRRREFEILDAAGKLHVLRAASDPEMYWWVRVFAVARNKIPPAKPIAPAPAPPRPHRGPGPVPVTVVGSHLRVDHVLCVVHGIGVSPDILAANIRQLQDTYAEVMDKVFPDVDFRVEILVIHWREALTKLDVHRKLQAVLPQDPLGDEANPLRQFMVHRIVDYVYYTHDRYRRHILREVTSQLNEQLTQFRNRRPDFDGKISVMGHSLGAALVYDLMCRKVHDDQVMLESEGMRLNFDAANLFCVGNPLGTFLGLDPTIGLGSDMLKLPFRIYNIFKFQDPIATRLEPLRDVKNEHVPPVVVPCWFNMGLRETTSQWLGGLWPGQKKKDGSAGDASPDAAGQSRSGSPSSTTKGVFDAANDGTDGVGVSPMPSQSSIPSTPRRASIGREGALGERLFRDASATSLGEMGNRESGMDENGVRLDYALQMSSTMEEVSTSWSALKAHTDYWGNRDAMLFMVSSMLKSTFGIADDADEALPDSMEKRIIDENILHKRRDDEDATVEKWVSDDVPLVVCVQQVVERIVDEAVATHELLKMHPGVRTRPGSVGLRSPVSSKTEIGEGDGKSGAGWAAYLRGGWFGGQSGTRGGSNGGSP